MGGLSHQGGAFGALQLDQLPPTRHHHLAHVLQAPFQFAQHLFGVAVGPLLDGTGLLAAAADQDLALLLALLAELQRIGVDAFRLGLAVPLDAQAFLANLFELLEALLAQALMLFAQLALEVDVFLVELLAPL